MLPTSLRMPAALALMCALCVTSARAQDSKPALDSAEPELYPELKIHAAPRALDKNARVEDWPEFLGPRRDATCRETLIDVEFDAQGPRLVWEMERGAGYASPAIAEGRLVFTHRSANTVHVDCLEAHTGKRYWRYSFACDYVGRYIRNGGPRATPTIAAGNVYIHNVDGELLALELDSGKLLWRKNTGKQYNVPESFFGVVASPLVADGQLIQNIGAPNGRCVAGFDLKTGALLWGLGKSWGASCASPIFADIHGKRKLFVLAGGISRPATGGLMAIDWESKKLEFEFAFRSRTVESVNGATPVIANDRIYLTASYSVGSVALDLDADGGFTELWKKKRGGQQFATQVFMDGVLYGSNGAPGRVGGLLAIDPATGAERWNEELVFQDKVRDRGGERPVTVSVGEGSLLVADGKLLLLGDTGVLVTLLPGKTGAKVLARTTLFQADETWTPPVISHGLLYVCQNNRARFGASPARLLCYDLRVPDEE